MNRPVITLLLTALVPGYAAAYQHTMSVDVTNTLDKSRTDCPVIISLDGIAVEGLNAKLIDGDTEVPCQLDDMDRDGIADELAFVIDMAPRQTKTLTLQLTDQGEQAQYTPRVWANFMIRGAKKGQTFDITEVTVPGDVNFYNAVHGHGPMFESELVGYRVYYNQKQTLDPYGKFNKGLELAETTFYPTDQQLADGAGDDVLMVGNSCGVGAFKGWNGDKATHIEPVKSRTERLVARGPVRAIVEVEVDDWDYQGGKIDMVNRYTLYAGHRDLQIDAIFRQPLDSQTFCTGAQRIMGTETVGWSDHDGVTASWGRHWPVTDTIKYAKETIGIATYVPKRYIVKEAIDPDNYLYIVSAPGSDTITYNTMFTSRKETFGYADSEAWFAYLPIWREELENPLVVKIYDKGHDN